MSRFSVLPLRCLQMLVTAALLCLLTVPAGAQVDPPEEEDDIIVGGVYISKDGLLGARKLDGSRRLMELRRSARLNQGKDKLNYISLPRLFADARKRIEAGQTLTEEMRYLGGMTKLKYVFVYPDEKDLIIAGVAEPYDKTDPKRPIGLVTGRPVWRLDDLVVTLRTLGPGCRTSAFGCSIDLPQGAMQRATAAQARLARASYATKKQRLAEAVGPQTVSFFGVEPDTRVAFTCLAADYRLKRLGLGLDPTPVPSVRYSVGSERAHNRWWFVTSFDPLLVSDDGNAFEIRGQSVKVATSGSLTTNAAPASPAAERFAASCTKHFERLSQGIPSWADLANLTDMALLAALINKDQLHRKAGWDVQWIQNPRGYPVQKIRVPRKTETFASRLGGGWAIGGVKVGPYDTVAPDAREIDSEGKLKTLGQKPGEGMWHTLQSPGESPGESSASK